MNLKKDDFIIPSDLDSRPRLQNTVSNPHRYLYHGNSKYSASLSSGQPAFPVVFVSFLSKANGLHCEPIINIMVILTQLLQFRIFGVIRTSVRVCSCVCWSVLARHVERVGI